MEASWLGERVGVAGDRGADLLGELLAELDAPLVEAVDAPHHALGEGEVLVERDQLAEHGRRQRGRHDRRGRPVAGEDPRGDDGLGRALRAHLVGGLAEGQRRGLREEVGQEQLVDVGVAVAVQRVRRLGERDEVGRDQPGALVDQLVERVLPVGAGLAPEDLAGVGGDRGAVPAHALAVGLHRQLLEVRREAVQQLGVGQHGVGLGAEEVGVPDVEQPHQEPARCAPSSVVRKCSSMVWKPARNSANRSRTDRDDERGADGRVDGVAAADPVPEAERVGGVDAEVGDLVERRRDRDEVLARPRPSASAGRRARRAARPCTAARWSASRACRRSCWTR